MGKMGFICSQHNKYQFKRYRLPSTMKTWLNISRGSLQGNNVFCSQLHFFFSISLIFFLQLNLNISVSFI